jgi:intergrase/recombinase
MEAKCRLFNVKNEMICKFSKKKFYEIVVPLCVMDFIMTR